MDDLVMITLRRAGVSVLTAALLGGGGLVASGVATAQPATGPGTAACKTAQDAFKEAREAFRDGKDAGKLRELRTQISLLRDELRELEPRIDDPNADPDADPPAQIPNPAYLELRDKIVGLELQVAGLKQRRDARDAAKAARDRACAPPVTPPVVAPPVIPPAVAPPAVTPPATTVVWCVIKPGVCSQVRVDSQTRLVEVLRDVPCAEEVTLPRVTGVSKGQKVTVIEEGYVADRYHSDPVLPYAPRPPVISSDLPVTH